jgi:N-acyl-D-aspartate/D-glutamate deacylase
VSLAEGVFKITGAPASRLGLQDRGRIAKGYKADVALFDLSAVRDLSTFEKPHKYAAGMHHVVVNGVFVLENGVMTGARPGRSLRRTP